MVPQTTNHELEQAGIVATSHQIFVQRWLELLDYRTIDSHAAKLLNANGALQELCQVVSATLESKMGKDHLHEVWTETREIIRDGPVIASHDQSLHTTLMNRLSAQPGASRSTAAPTDR